MHVNTGHVIGPCVSGLCTRGQFRPLCLGVVNEGTSEFYLVGPPVSLIQQGGKTRVIRYVCSLGLKCSIYMTMSNIVYVHGWH